MTKYGETQTPCSRCKIPQLLSGNVLAWQVVAYCSSQLMVVGMGTPLGFIFDAITISMEMVGIHPLDWNWTFFKVNEVGKAYAKHLNEQIEANKPADQKTNKPALNKPPRFTEQEWLAREAYFNQEIERLRFERLIGLEEDDLFAEQQV